MIVARVIVISALLWLGQASAQRPPSDERPPCPCPQATNLMPLNSDMYAMAGDEPRTPPPPGMPGRGGMDRMMAERGKQVERIRTRKLLELLDLPAAKESLFLDVFRNMRREQRRIDIERHMIVGQLADMVRERKPDNDSLNALVSRRHALEKDREQVMDGFLTKVRTILTPVQVAKLVVFEDRFEMAMLEQMRNFREHRMGMPRGPRDRQEPPPDIDSDN